jgi:hypothetical protein
LSHRLNRFDDILGSDGPVSINGSADGGGATRDGVDEVGDVVVCGTNSMVVGSCQCQVIIVHLCCNNYDEDLVAERRTVQHSTIEVRIV